MDLTFSKSIGSCKECVLMKSLTRVAIASIKITAYFLPEPITWTFLSINLLGCAETEHNLNEV